MELSIKSLPLGALPYTDESIATRMMLKLFEGVPYLPAFPLIDKNDNVIRRTLEKLPGIIIRENKILFSDKTEKFAAAFEKMDIIYNNPTDEMLEKYKFEAFYMKKFFQIIERVKPEQAIINFIGPFTLSQIIANKEKPQLLIDKFTRKFLIEALTLRAMWIIRKIKSFSPNTRPVIIFEENRLNEFGVLKKEYEDITKDIVVNMFSKIINRLHEEGAFVGIQSFNKCDWQIPIESGVDMISYDAYNNPNNLGIIADKINAFLADGGIINWAFVPVMSESIVKSLSIHNISDRFIKTMQELIISGVNRELVLSRSTVSVQGDTTDLPLIFAEKALILSTQLGSKVFKH